MPTHKLLPAPQKDLQCHACCEPGPLFPIFDGTILFCADCFADKAFVVRIERYFSEPEPFRLTPPPG
jgi:hypothetical protein